MPQRYYSPSDPDAKDCGCECIVLMLSFYGTLHVRTLNNLPSIVLTCFRHIYFLPFYFQAVKGTTAEGSGIRTIPYLVSITLASIFIGGSVSKFGWYTPFMWFGAAIFTIGSGMLYTLQVGSNSGVWIGYQILTGIGAGASVQIPFIAVQVVLNEKDMPTGSKCYYSGVGVC